MHSMLWSKWPHPSAKKLHAGRAKMRQHSFTLATGICTRCRCTSPVDVQRTEAYRMPSPAENMATQKSMQKPINKASMHALSRSIWLKDEHEFFDTSALEWIPDPDFAGVSQKLLSHDNSGASTQLSRWDAGLDTSPGGIISHDFAEEVFLLSGELTDLTLNKTFLPGAYTSRQPNMPHGPYTTRTGCIMLVIATPV